MSVFKDFPDLENPEKKFNDFHGPTRAPCTTGHLSLDVKMHTIKLKPY